MSLHQQHYYINTAFKKSGTNSNFSYEIQIPMAAQFDRVVVMSASIPNTFYLIQDGYNTFTLRERGIDTVITIPPGNYSAKVFALTVIPLMNQASPNAWLYTMSLPNQNLEASTGKFTYSISGNESTPNEQPSIICTSNVNEQLGFDIGSINTFENNELASMTTVNFGPENTMFLHSNIADSGSNSDVLQEFFGNNTEFLSYVSYQCSAPELYSKALRTDKSNLFDFSLTNEKGQLLDLHGVDMMITICLYKHDRTNELVQQYIKYKVGSEPTTE
jgi:hypothetical protein